MPLEEPTTSEVFDRLRRLAGAAGVWIALLFGLVLACPVAAQNQPAETRQIGFALHMEGAWLANGQPILGNGASLEAKAAISLSSDTDFRSGQDLTLTVVLLNGRTVPLRCNSFESCHKLLPYTLPDSLAEHSPVLERLERAVARLLFRDPDRYISPLSRAAGPPQKLKEDVLRLDGGRLSIGVWLQNVEPGAYTLVLVYIGRDNRSSNPPVLRFEWAGNPAATIEAKDVTPGLYEAQLLPARSVLNQPVSEDAWVVVAAPATHEKDAAAYHNCTSSIAGWTQIDPSDVQTFLRACLDQVASPVPPDDTKR